MKRDVSERFWEKVDADGDCWTWTAHRDKDGYGTFYIERDGRNTTMRAHIVAWELSNGPVPKGLCVCHTCDNPPCVRLDHLFLDTNAGNLADMAAKGRSVKGRRSPIQHGTYAGARRHYRYGEQPCDACRQAQRTYYRKEET